MSCSARCRRAAPGHCCCECGGAEHGAEAEVQQLHGPWEFFTVGHAEVVLENVEPAPPKQPVVVERRSSIERDGLLLIPGRRVDADGNEWAGWIAAEVGTRRRLAWGLTQEEALAHSRAARR